ncbi:MAG: hypothetical protein GY754_41500 [bacterium]|nr:hypothetical protein [bacterium]
MALLSGDPSTYQLSLLLTSAIIMTNNFNMTIGFGPAISGTAGVGLGVVPIEMVSTFQETKVWGEDAIANLEEKYKVKGK